MFITIKLAAFGSMDFPENFCQEIMAVLGTRIIILSDFLGIAQKVRHFLIFVPKIAMISWQKLSGKSMEPKAASFVVISMGL